MTETMKHKPGTLSCTVSGNASVDTRTSKQIHAYKQGNFEAMIYRVVKIALPNGSWSALRARLSKFDVVLLGHKFKAGIIAVRAHKLVNFVRVNVVTIDRFVVAGNVAVGVIRTIIRRGVVIGASHEAGSLAVRQLTALDFTDTRIAKVGAFKDMALGTVGATIAVAMEAKGPAHGCARGNLGVSIGTMGIGTIAFGIVNAKRRAFRCQVVR